MLSDVRFREGGTVSRQGVEIRMSENSMNRTRNVEIRGTVKVTVVRWRWFGHVLSGDGDYVRQRMLEMELEKSRKTQGSFMDVVKNELEVVGVRGD